MEFGLEVYQRLLAIIVFDILLLVTKLFSNNCGPYLDNTTSRTFVLPLLSPWVTRSLSLCLHAESDLPTLIWRFFIISSSICLDLSFFSLLFKELIFTPLRNLPRSSNWILPLIDFVRDKWWSWWVQSPSCWHREAHHLPGSVISLPHSKESGLKEQAHHSSTCSDYCHANLVSLYDHLPSAL